MGMMQEAKDGKELYAAARDFARKTLASGQGTPLRSLTLPARQAPAEPRGRAEQLVIQLLRRAVGAGFHDRQRLQTEEAFTSLRPRAEFQELLARPQR